MLSPASLGICCLAAMAPALTKAVSQAEDFNIPHFYQKSGVSFLNYNLQYSANDDYVSLRLNDNKTERASYSLTFDKALTDNFCPKYHFIKWLVSTHKLKLNDSLSFGDLFKDPSCDKNAVFCNGLWPCSCVGGEHPTIQTLCKNTMSNDTLVSQDRMGLLNANTSLECDLKSKISLECNDMTNDISAYLKNTVNLPNMPLDITAETSHHIGLLTNCQNDESGLSKTEVLCEEVQRAKDSNIMHLQRAKELLSRLRALQVKQSKDHISEQLKYFVEYQQKSLGISCQRQKRNTFRCAKDSADLKTELLKTEGVRNLSTAALVNLVRKLESSVPGKLLQSSKSSVSAYTESRSERVLVKLNVPECAEINRVSGTLLTNLHYLESVVDSDVTESSSGGESCDEFDDYEDKKIQHPPPIHKRALWKWAVDRAAVASRWTWLQAQVSDLEYRIRQQNDIYHQLRSSKGSVSFDQLPVLEPTIPSATDPCPNAAVNQVTSKHISLTVNGFLDRGSVVTSNGYHTVLAIPPSSDQCVDFQLKQQHLSPESTVCQTSSRTLPLTATFRKRKFVRTTGLHLTCRKAARLSTIKCSCSSQSGVMPCTLCGGRYNNSQSVDPDTMPLLERIALLDPCFHPVLSFEQDIPLSLHFENLLKKNEQYRFASRSGPSLQKKPRLSVTSHSFADSSRKHSTKLAQNVAQALLSSAKYRKKHVGRKPGSRHYHKRENFIKKWRRLPRTSSVLTFHERRRRFSGASSDESSKPGSPIHHSSAISDESEFGRTLLNSTPGFGRSGLLQEHGKKRRDNAFDINNIVIPYSMASSTRPEKPQYKEILTPKWRIVDDHHLSGDENGTLKSDDEEMEEDASEETVIRRHQRCEDDEKKHFVTLLNFPNQTRGRFRGSRFDSRADSSGANTPDPLSPFQQDIMFQDSNSLVTGGPNSPAMSPPEIPVSVAVLSDDSQPSGNSLPAQRFERRRTISQNRRDRPIEEITKPQEKEFVYCSPYESRIFPLLDVELEEMLKDSPHHCIIDLPPKGPSSPGSSESTSTASSIPDEEDMDDPEWTVVSQKKEGADQTLIMKFAKR